MPGRAGQPGRQGGRRAGPAPRAGARQARCAIEIRKRIPVAAGLAGGSADAAATLVACNELWQTGLAGPNSARSAPSLGSDVRSRCSAGPRSARGRGEQLTAALAAGTYHWVLAFAAGGLSTPEVYATCDRLRAAGAALAGPPPGPSSAPR